LNTRININKTILKTPTTQIPTSKKIFFGLGMLAMQMFPAALGVFMVVLVEDFGFDPLMWGLIFFLPRVVDAITDPVMGFVSDNTKSRWGRRRQYIFVGAILMGITFIAMWQLYPENGLNYNFWYFLILSVVFYLGLTIFSVPYVALGYEMSTDFHERTRIMAVSQWIGQWAWVIVPWFWVIIYDDTWFSSPEAGTRTLAIYVSIFCTALALVPALFIKGESSLNDKNLSPITLGNIRSSISTLVKGFKDDANNTPFMRLCVATFFIFNSFQTIAAFSFFIIVYYLFQGDAGAAGIWPTLHGSVGALLTTFLVIPIVTKMSEKWGKKKTFMISQAISILGYILFWFLFIPGKPYMFLFALPLFSFGIGGLFTLMMSMTADTCDLDELNNGLPRKEATFGAIYWWMVKFGTALAGLFSGIIMSYVGFDANLSAQPDGAMTGLRIFYSVLPVIGTAIAIYVMKNYDINEARAKEISETLNKRNAK